ncbi:light chain of dynein [Chloropicon roscoffensis]|uniref:Dynein axonemal light chain 1 n=1 Tax=Chloropicon roscoffensis TaxID=1461544 RepID=A0AAX4NY02_9CHLO
MAPATALKDAIKNFEAAKGVKAAETEKVELYGQEPPIVKLDSALGTLKACKHLALSTNCIASIQNLAGLENLKVLSLGRNQIKKFDNIEAVSSTLEEIWISYNLIESLSGLDKAKGLKKLYMSNNLIAKWSEIEKLQANPELEEVLFVGNPFVDEDNAAYRIQMIKTLPNLKKIDGLPVDVDEREAAQAE